MQQADGVSSYAREDRPRIHGVRSLMSYSNIILSTNFVAVRTSQKRWIIGTRNTGWLLARMATTARAFTPQRFI